jgi:hypothetical protein
MSVLPPPPSQTPSSTRILRSSPPQIPYTDQSQKQSCKRLIDNKLINNGSSKKPTVKVEETQFIDQPNNPDRYITSAFARLTVCNGLTVNQEWIQNELNVHQISDDSNQILSKLPDAYKQDIENAIKFKLCLQTNPIPILTEPSYQRGSNPYTVNDLCVFFKGSNEYPEVLEGVPLSYDIQKYILQSSDFDAIKQSALWRHMVSCYSDDDEQIMYETAKINNLIIRNVIYGYWFYVSLKNWGATVTSKSGSGIKVYTGFNNYNHFFETITAIERGVTSNRRVTRSSPEQFTIGKQITNITNITFTSCSTDILTASRFGQNIFEILFPPGSKLPYIQEVPIVWDTTNGPIGEHEIILNVGIILEYVGKTNVEIGEINGEDQTVYKFRIVDQTDISIDTFIAGGNRLSNLLLENMRNLYCDKDQKNNLTRCGTMPLPPLLQVQQPQQQPLPPLPPLGGGKKTKKVKSSKNKKSKSRKRKSKKSKSRKRKSKKSKRRKQSKSKY